MTLRILFFLFFSLIGVVGSRAQDILPSTPPLQFQEYVLPLPPLFNPNISEFLREEKVVGSRFMQHLQENEIKGDIKELAPFFTLLKSSIESHSSQPIRILHIGDSHVHGHIFTHAFAERMYGVSSTISCKDMGINGAMAVKMASSYYAQRMANYDPQLIVISFGTNESHNTNYSVQQHEQQLSALLNNIRSKMPHVPLLFTTPPGSFFRHRIERRKYTYRENYITPKVVTTIVSFATNHHIPYWDLYHIMGGKDYVYSNWWRSGYMRPDHIHFTPEGYSYQGQLLQQALIKAYNKYVAYQ